MFAFQLQLNFNNLGVILGWASNTRTSQGYDAFVARRMEMDLNLSGSWSAGHQGC